MKRAILILCIIIFTAAAGHAATVSGGISKLDIGKSGIVVDSNTNTPIDRAKVSVPKYNYSTFTDENGTFSLGAINGTTIMSVEKDGYKPFSLTVNEMIASRPMVLGIQKSNIADIIIETEMMHLGDDNYSDSSANAGNFKLRSSGPFYTKTFTMDINAGSKKNYLVIGSIVGIDTAMARSMGQNKITTSYASPPEVYFNGTKIAEIQLNGDNQKIKLPNNLVKPGQSNEITIKTGRNMMQMAYIDYDDIEIANLSVTSE